MAIIDPKDTEQVERLNKRMLYVVAGVVLLVSFAGLLALKRQDRSAQTKALRSGVSTAAAGEPWYRAKPDNLLFEQVVVPTPRAVAVAKDSNEGEQLEKKRLDVELQAMQASVLVSIRRPDSLRSTEDTRSTVAARPAASTSQLLASATVDDANLQLRKEAFLDAAGREGIEEYLPETVHEPISPYELKAGSVIPAVLITEINSDLPGQILAQVRENVFDSGSGKHLLIPQGAKLLGRYDSQVAFGQRRVLVTWERLIFPDGRAITLRGMPGTDGAGAAGLTDLVDNHYGRVFGGAILLSAISAGAQLSQPQSNSFENDSAGEVAAGALGQQLGQVSSELVRKNLQVQPTLKVRAGYRFNVLVNRDVVMEPTTG